MTHRLTWRVVAAVLALAWVAMGQLVGPTSASLNARVRNDNNEFSTAALEAPDTLAGTVSGRTVQLAWNAGKNGTSYSVRRGPAVAGSCSDASVSQVATPSPMSYTDSFYQPQGTTFCYEVATRHSSWTSVNNNPRIPVRVGFFVESVTLNGGNGALNSGDTITVAFNQPVGLIGRPASTTTVCSTSSTGSARLVIGSTGVSTCAASDVGTVGFISGLTSSRNNRYAASYDWGEDGRTLTVTVGDRIAGNGNPTLSGSGIFNPTTVATALLSDSGNHHVCDSNTGGGDCLRAATGSI